MKRLLQLGISATMLASAASAQYTWVGPLFPPDGGVTISSSGDIGIGTGRTITFSNLNTTQYTVLLWTLVQGATKINMSYQGAFSGSDVLTYDGITASTIRWTGTSNMVYLVSSLPTNIPCETRLTATAINKCAPVDGGDYNLGSQGGLIRVVTAGSNTFSVRLLAEARPQTGGAWLPISTFYSQYSHPQGYQLGIAYDGGFFESMDRFYSGQIIDPTYKGTDLGLSKITFTCEVQKLDGTVVASFDFKPEDNGNFEAHDSTPFVTGAYNLVLKGPHWLKKKIGPIALLADSNGGLDFNVINGDVDGSNYIGTDDYLVLNSSFDTSKGDAGFVVNADLDGDGYIGTDDYLILNANFDTSGD